MKNKEIPDIITDSICVDASCARNPGPVEYRGVDTTTGEILFSESLPDGTNNIGEFLAIVDGLRFLNERGMIKKPIYSDSYIAIRWVKWRIASTTLSRREDNKKVFEKLREAVMWLKNNKVKNPVLKWHTKQWGEIKADYGRK